MDLKRLKNILLNNISLALFLTIPVVIILEHSMNKYHLEMNGPLKWNLYKYLLCSDLNNDGQSDR